MKCGVVVVKLEERYQCQACYKFNKCIYHVPNLHVPLGKLTPFNLQELYSYLFLTQTHRDTYTRKMSTKVRTEYIQRNLQPILPHPSPERVNVAFETPEASPSHTFHPATNSEMLTSASGIDIEHMKTEQDPGARDDDYGDDGPPTSRLRSLLEQTTHQVRESVTVLN
jgi:hypothetical protein